jgi:transposase
VRFVEEELVPQMTPGQVLVLDNLPAHRSPRVDTLVQAAGCHVLRLPPYSPDYNPIEMAISKMKRLLRSESARTIDTLMPAIDHALRAVTSDDAEAFIRHCGYPDTIV